MIICVKLKLIDNCVRRAKAHPTVRFKRMSPILFLAYCFLSQKLFISLLKSSDTGI